MAQAADRFSKLAETNLPGVTAIQWFPQAAGKPLSHSEAIASELLGGPLDHSDPRVKALRQRLVERDWPDDARIIPHLAPQVGVTHKLTPRERVADTAFTSPNWAGSTIQGTWAHAVGIWRVPTVTVPDTPPGTDGGWNSSSWAGIDGTYGSNDVLQAGVEQSVGDDFSTTYVAWFEWYAPEVDGSPDYIHQTNIDNMPIQPGDEVFAGVHYQNGQGFVMFGNVDAGLYFSIQLDAPPGASFSGNSVEWIVEAPKIDGAIASLPRFTPVNFTSAVGSDANATVTADPKTGDTTNIVEFGMSLTSVKLATDALTVDYYLDAGFAGWAQVGGVKVVTGDFNGNGFTDIALIGGPGWNTVPVAFSQGDGSWKVTNLGVGQFGAWAAAPGVKVVTGDFNGNGRTDIALAGGRGWITAPVAFSQGDGSWNVTNLTAE